MTTVAKTSSTVTILTCIAAALGLLLLARWYWNEIRTLRRKRRNARRIRNWRERMTAMGDQPFHLKLLTKTERTQLIGRNGLTSDQWARSWAADFIAGRRNHQPTCADYLHEFGEQPTVRPAKTRTPVRN